MNPSSFVEVKYCYLSDTDKLQQSEALPLLVQEQFSYTLGQPEWKEDFCHV